MSISSSLTITLISNDGDQYNFDCKGSIDAHASPAFSAFNSIPYGASVILDFSHVERVNSMGLSLLLKLFDEWENNSSAIEVRNLNRMVNMLFKITGLGRFAKGAETTMTGTRPIDPVAPVHAYKNDVEITSETANRSKLFFAASLQTGDQLT